jgi:hypothetical protein
MKEIMLENKENYAVLSDKQVVPTVTYSLCFDLYSNYITAKEQIHKKKFRFQRKIK